jgi:hypothetical protein
MKNSKHENPDISLKEIENRIVKDRRKCPTPIIGRYAFFGGSRKTIRRQAERKKHLFVDLYSTRLLIAVMCILLLSCIDAYLTLELIGKGSAVEANPFMAFFLEYGILPFTLTKFIITAFSLTILCLSKNSRITRICLPIAINMYLLVVIYEFYLFII